MKLTLYTDYALRIMLYLALHPDRDVPVREIAAAYRISEDHVAKAAKDLTRARYLEAKRGRSGGVRLSRPAAAINLGEVVRATEELTLVECFDAASDGCVLSPSCLLRGALAEARDAFLLALDRYSLADLVGRRRSALQRLLERAEPAQRAARLRGA